MEWLIFVGRGRGRGLVVGVWIRAAPKKLLECTEMCLRFLGDVQYALVIVVFRKILTADQQLSGPQYAASLE